MSEPLADDVEGLEALLLAARHAAPAPAMRGRVLAAMDLAAAEREAMLADHLRAGPWRRARSRLLLPETVAAAAAALAILVIASGGGRRPDADAPPRRALATITVERSDDPPDLHRALELLDARRDHFAGVGQAFLPVRN